MSMFQVVKLSRAPAAGLAAVGILWGGMAASWPDIKAQVMASDAELGVAQLMSAVGGLIAMAMAPRIGRFLGRWAMPVIAVLLATAFFFPLIAWDVPTLAIALFALGLSVASLDILTNVEISAREAKHGVHLMGFNHAMFSFAFAASAYGAALGRQAGYGPAEIFPFLSCACLVLAVISYLPHSAQDVSQDGLRIVGGGWLSQRLLVQAFADWELGRGQVVPAAPLRSRWWRANSLRKTSSMRTSLTRSAWTL